MLVANNTSFVAQNGTNISDNTGPGVLVEIDASASFATTTISNNTEEGILLRRVAVGEFFAQPADVFGNGVADLACDDTSLAFGELQGVVNNTCKTIEKKKKVK